MNILLLFVVHDLPMQHCQINLYLEQFFNWTAQNHTVQNDQIGQFSSFESAFFIFVKACISTCPCISPNSFFYRDAFLLSNGSAAFTDTTDS